MDEIDGESTTGVTFDEWASRDYYPMHVVGVSMSVCLCRSVESLG